MAFMRPEYVHDVFVTVESLDEPVSLPLRDYLVTNYGPSVEASEHPIGYWARLSANGYLDATEWSGPFDTIELAKAHIEQMYDVDPTTGDDLEDLERVDVDNAQRKP